MPTAASAHAQLRQALVRGNLPAALTAAHDLPVVGLETALELLLLVREKDPDSYGRWAARWLARYIAENPTVDLTETQLVAAALDAVRGEDPRLGAFTLLAVCRRRKLTAVENVVRRWLEA